MAAFMLLHTHQYIWRIRSILLQQLDDRRPDDHAIGVSAIFFACSGVEIPNPIAAGILVFSRTVSTMDARSV